MFLMTMSKNDQLMEVVNCTAQVVIQNHADRISAGYTWCSQVCRAEEKNDQCSGKKLEDGYVFLKSGDAPWLTAMQKKAAGTNKDTKSTQKAQKAT